MAANGVPRYASRLYRALLAKIATPGVGPGERWSFVSHYHREGTGIAFTISIPQYIRDEVRLMRVVKGRDREFELV